VYSCRGSLAMPGEDSVQVVENGFFHVRRLSFTDLGEKIVHESVSLNEEASSGILRSSTYCQSTSTRDRSNFGSPVIPGCCKAKLIRRLSVRPPSVHFNEACNCDLVPPSRGSSLSLPRDRLRQERSTQISSAEADERLATLLRIYRREKASRETQ
jgi:hypothetical protein